MIPKVFHLTSKSKDIPPQFQKNVDRIRALYPGHQIRIHDDDDIMGFIKDNYPNYYQETITKMPKFIMIVDTVRYMWMGHYGGIYCDMDVFFRKRFEFDEGVLFAEREWTWPKDSSITDSVHNCWFASVPGHPIWTDLLDGIAENVRAMGVPGTRASLYAKKVLTKLRLRKPDYPAVFNLTGPNAISKILTKRALLRRYPDVRVAPAEVIFQKGMSKGQPSDAFVVHETAGSWQE